MNDLRSELLLYLRQLSEEEPVLVLEHPPPSSPPGDRGEEKNSVYTPESSGGIEEKVVDDENVRALIELEREASTCKLCDLYRTRQNVVFGTGDPKAKLIFIGEAPGVEEDRQGEPFVGRAGQLLNKILKALELERSEVYIGNILKCRPPNNRNPEPHEAAACLPYLRRQIELIQPVVIVALGLVAAVRLMGIASNVSLKSLRGRIFNYEERPLVVTYHPAALLRNPGFKVPTWEDMQKVMKLISGEIKWQSDDENLLL